MAGFFDFLNSQDPMKQQSLLAAAAAMLQGAGDPHKPFGFGQALGGGIGAYQQSMLQQQQSAQQQALRDLQIKAAQGELDDQGQARQQNRDILEAARNSFQSPVQQALAGGGGPTNENAALISQMKGGFDTDGFLNQMMKINPLEGVKYAQLLKKSEDEFNPTPQTGTHADGSTFQYLISKSGKTKILDDTLPRDELHWLDTGGKQLGVNKYTGAVGASIGNTMSPSAAAANALGYANLGISRERLNLERSQLGKPVFNAEAGGWVLPPSADNPGGKLLPVAGVGGKAPTEFQGKSAAFGLRATEANKILTKLEGDYSPSGVNVKNAMGGVWGVGGLLSSGANSMLSDSSQQVDQAQRDFINSILRQESGAAIGASEFDNAAKQYFPQPGDSAPVKAQKARNRQLAIQGLQANAGKAALTAPAAPGGWSITKVE